MLMSAASAAIAATGSVVAVEKALTYPAAAVAQTVVAAIMRGGVSAHADV
jgi:hypothetical protein